MFLLKYSDHFKEDLKYYKQNWLLLFICYFLTELLHSRFIAGGF